MANPGPSAARLETQAKLALTQLTNRAFDDGFEAGVKAGFDNARILYDRDHPNYTGTPEQEQARDLYEKKASAIMGDLDSIAKQLGLKLVERTPEDDEHDQQVEAEHNRGDEGEDDCEICGPVCEYR